MRRLEDKSRAQEEHMNRHDEENCETNEEDERGRVAPDNGCRWRTPPGHVGSRKGRKRHEC